MIVAGNGKEKLIFRESINISSSELINKVKQLVHEGNIRRLKLIHKDKTLLDLPVSVGAPTVAVGIAVAPLLAAVAVIAAMKIECTVEVEREESDEGGGNSN